jgi:DNA-binding NtrC family response regulator
VQRLRRATVFVDELEALSSYMQAHLLEAVEPPVLDWLGTGVTISLVAE